MRPTMRNEVHVSTSSNGHHLSTDCWCEPVLINWVTNRHGVKVLVVEHHDETMKHRILVVAERERDKSTPCSEPYALVPINRSIDAPWITRDLCGPFPQQLPPLDDPNERKL